MNILYRKLLLAILAFILFSFVEKTRECSAQSVSQRPNVIFILVDDMGYGDLSVYGNKEVLTPNIDGLANEGRLFTQFYVNSPICSPSRVALTTGQYPLRWNITSFLADSTRNINRGMAHYLDPKAPSLARILQQNGYYTAHIGKWYMGGQRNVHGAPMITEFGFETSLTSFEGLGERLGWIFETHQWKGDHRFPLSVEQEKLGHGNVRWIKRHTESQIYVDRVIEEIQKAKDKNQPFYINLWTSDVHIPAEASPEFRGDGSVHSQYHGMITGLDLQLGRLFGHIRNNPQLRDDTIIIFASDNGPAAVVGSSGGLRGRKGQLYEGGIREPFIVWAPCKMNPAIVGTVNNTTVVAGMDIPPTILAVIGIKVPESIKFDGLNMQEVLFGESTNTRELPVMWVRPPETKGPKHEFNDLAIREGKWKLLINTNGKNAELYDIENNPNETINLAEQKPEVAAQLKIKVLNWFYAIRTDSLASAKAWED